MTTTTAATTASDAAGETAIYRIIINATLEVVWNTLVKTDAALPFFFGSVCRTEAGLVPGRPLAMRSPDGRFTSVVGKVLEFTPPHRYAHTLKFTNLTESPVTIVYDLKQVEGGVEFTLTTLGAIPGSKTAKTMADGGPFIIRTLKEVAETGRPGFKSSLLLGLIRLMTPFTPKACRSEAWSFEAIERL